MKTYLSPHELEARVEHELTSNRPSFHHSPLEDVIEILCEGRHYSWMGIYLAAGEKSQQLLEGGQDAHPAQVALPETRSKILVAIKLAGHELGVLAVESDRENAFSSEDRVLLENVATRLARFLSGPGKYIVRKAKQAAEQKVAKSSGPKFDTAGARTVRSAAVGEK